MNSTTRTSQFPSGSDWIRIHCHKTMKTNTRSVICYYIKYNFYLPLDFCWKAVRSSFPLCHVLRVPIETLFLHSFCQELSFSFQQPDTQHRYAKNEFCTWLFNQLITRFVSLQLFTIIGFEKASSVQICSLHLPCN